jgi:hypothetical protein
MLTCHEIFGFMPATLAVEILEALFVSDKPTYRSALDAVADARRVRPEFLLKKPKTDRHRDMIPILTRPRFEEMSSLLLRQWLTKTQLPMLVDFLNRLGITHREGMVDAFPEKMDDAMLKTAVDEILAKYPAKNAAIYLHCLLAMQLVAWPNLTEMLQQDPRLQLM